MHNEKQHHWVLGWFYDFPFYFSSSLVFLHLNKFFFLLFRRFQTCRYFCCCCFSLYFRSCFHWKICYMCLQANNRSPYLTIVSTCISSVYRFTNDDDTKWTVSNMGSSRKQWTRTTNIRSSKKRKTLWKKKTSPSLPLAFYCLCMSLFIDVFFVFVSAVLVWWFLTFSTLKTITFATEFQLENKRTLFSIHCWSQQQGQ